MLKRPSHQETEEDLLRYQQEFLSSKSKPAAQVVRTGDKRKTGEAATVSSGELADEKPQSFRKDVISLGELPQDFSHKTTVPPVKKSKFGKERKSQKRERWTESAVDAEESLEKHDTHIAKVLSDIVERDLKQAPVYYPPSATLTGFPAVLHRGPDPPSAKTGQSSGKKRSLFAQQFRQKANEREHRTDRQQPPLADEVQEHKISTHDEQDVAMETRSVEEASFNQCSVVCGSGLNDRGEDEAKKIHDENVTKLSEMSEREILEEQQKLLESLDPSLVSFLRSKKNQQQSSPGGTENQDPPTTCAAQDAVSRKNEGKYEPSVEVKSTWLNMETVEEDKLQWASDLPDSSDEASKAGKPIRFNLQGEIVTQSDLPTHLGLHHHGDEPDRPGYTLAELFTLARSANMQQRALALNVLSKVICNARRGVFTDFVSQPVLAALIDGGVVFITRWALDDSTENTMTAAVQLLQSLLVSTEDEEVADHVFNWPHGMELCQLRPAQTQPSDTEDGEDGDKSLSDADTLKQDIIKGLLKMSLLNRLRFIIEVWRPAASIVVSILQIITRIARHSPESAYMVMQCPRLIGVIKSEFLVPNWHVNEDQGSITDVYGRPLPAAMKLMCVLCLAGRNMAAILISNYGLFDSISRYTAQEPSLLGVTDSHELYVESMRTWRVCLSYGLAVSHFTDLFPSLMARLQSAATDIQPDQNPSLQQQRCTLLAVLESVTIAKTNIAKNMPPSHMRPDNNDDMAMPDNPWNDVAGLLSPVLLCLGHEIKKFQDDYVPQRCDVSVLAGTVSFLASHFSCLEKLGSYDFVDTLSQMENLCTEVIIPCLKSLSFSRVLQHAREQSPLLQHKTRKGDVITSLPQLNALLASPIQVESGSQAAAPDTKADSPLLLKSHAISLVIAMARLLVVMGKLNKKIASEVFDHVLKHEETLQYVRSVCRCSNRPGELSFFSRFDNILQYYLITMARMKGSCDLQLYHKMALHLLTYIHDGDEHLVHDLMSFVVFNADFMRPIQNKGEVLSEFDDKLHLVKGEPVSSATLNTSTLTRQQLLDKTCDNLPSIRSTYINVASSLCPSVKNSRSRFLHHSSDTETLMLGTVGNCLVPVDWPFLPLVTLYSAVNAVGKASEARVPVNDVSMVLSTLQWLHLLECDSSAVIDGVSPALKLSRVMCTFLTGTDIFLDMNIHAYLEALLHIYSQSRFLERLNLEETIPGLASFYDLFTSVLDQYEAVSFGDALFGSYVTIPMQQRHAVRFRKAVWGEHASILRTLSLPIKQLIIPVVKFLEPDETNVELIRFYIQSLLSGEASPRWSPLLYLIAVHHTNRFIYTQVSLSDKEESVRHQRLRKASLLQFISTKNQVLQHHVLHYKMADITCDRGMVLYESLPPIRQKLIDSVQSTPTHCDGP